MLAGGGQPDHPRILDFTEDNCVALSIMMNIIHFRWDGVPVTLELGTLADLAVLTDKYMLTAHVSPWLHQCL